MKISIGSDHAGYQWKEKVKAILLRLGHQVTDHGTDSTESVDYPDYGARVAEDVAGGRADTGVAICWTGNGMNMTVKAGQNLKSEGGMNVESKAAMNMTNKAGMSMTSWNSFLLSYGSSFSGTRRNAGSAVSCSVLIARRCAEPSSTPGASIDRARRWSRPGTSQSP